MTGQGVKGLPPLFAGHRLADGVLEDAAVGAGEVGGSAGVVAPDQVDGFVQI
ncbi:MAG: hypothetical protein MJA27_18480 [Pseudanabaenales cyanobacterium]|nr:hypothetical protein [Pseudanabaenales cyanobacterium]